MILMAYVAQLMQHGPAFGACHLLQTCALEGTDTSAVYALYARGLCQHVSVAMSGDQSVPVQSYPRTTSKG